MKKLVRAGSCYLWALTVEKYLGITLLALSIGAAIAAMTYTMLVLIQTFCWR